MKALSVRQPWADLIASGKKTIEMRSRPTRYRGPLVICSTKVGKVPGTTRCIVDVVDCREFTRKDAAAACWKPDRAPGTPYAFSWVLANVRPVTQRPVRGRLGIFDLEGRL